MLKIGQLTFNALGENTYVIWDDATKEAAIIDPGCYDAEEETELKDFIEQQQLAPKYILSTHSHVDHVLGNFFVKKTWDLPLYVGTKDADTLRAVASYAPSYGFFKYQPTEPDRLLEEGDQIMLGSIVLDVIFVPGHAPGHIAFIDHTGKHCFSGDVLFSGSIGRSDLPGGNYDVLEQSIRKKLYTLPDDYIVYPGHGPTTTIKREKASNAFVRA